MKALINRNPRDLQQAVTFAEQARASGSQAMIAGGGSDLLGMVKDRIVAPDVLIHLRAIKGLDQVTRGEWSRQYRRPDYARCAEPSSGDPARLRGAGRSRRKRGDAADPQRRDAGGQCVPAPVVLVFPQRVPVLQGRRQHLLFNHRRKSVPRHLRRRSQLHRPSVGYRARAGGAWTRSSASSDLRASERFQRPTSLSCRSKTRRARMRSATMKCWRRSNFRPPVLELAARITRCSTAKPGPTQWCRPPSCFEMDKDVCRSARVVLGGVAPIPWRVPEAERLLTGQRVTPELAAKVAATAVAGATPLAKNAYKVPLTREIVQRTVLGLATRA